MTTLETERLLLRPWCDADLAPFAAMNGDVRVMEHFVSTIAPAESDGFVRRIREHFELHGYGLFAVEVKGGAPFIGFVGLCHLGFDAPFAPAVEIGWRLAHSAWGKGYASEGARAALRFGFLEAGLAEIVSFTAEHNLRSRAVMERIGLRHDRAGDFDHPRVPAGHPIRRHVLYRIGCEHWAAVHSRASD